MIQSIIIEADKARNLRFTSRTISQLEKSLNKPALKFLAEFEDENKVMEMTVDDYVSLFWHALIWEDKEITKDECFDLWDLYKEKVGFDKALENIMTALSNYFGVEEEKNEHKEYMKKKSMGK
jgi:hypothetical protein